MKSMKRMLCVLAAAALFVMAVGCGKTITTAHVENAIATAEIDSEGKPGAEVASFAPDAPVIYASAELRNAPDHTAIRVVWTYDTAGQSVGETTLDSGDIADRYIYSNLEPSEPLPEGDYRVDFYIEDRDEPDATVRFTVEEAAGAEKGVAAAVPDAGGVYVEDVHLTSGFDDAGQPLDTLTQVGPEGPWLVSAVLRNTQPDTKIRFVWFTPEEEKIAEYTLDPAGQADIYISGSLEPYEPMPDGTYYVALYAEGADDPLAVLDFTVSGAAAETSAAAELLSYTQESAGFTIGYPDGWEVLPLDEQNAVVFYPMEFVDEDHSELNAVFCYTVSDLEAMPTLQEYLDYTVSSTEEDPPENYKSIGSSIRSLDGLDMARYAYTYTEYGLNLTRVEFSTVDEDTIYIIELTATDEALDAMYDLFEAMALSFTIT